MKLLILALFAGMCASLGSGLFYLLRAKGDDAQANSAKLTRALTLRVSLAVLLFLALMGAWLAGWIQPHGLAR